MNSIERLVEVASPPLAQAASKGDGVPGALFPLVAARNGFYAFESALHVYPWADLRGSIQDWNDPDRWQKEYGDAVLGLTFFAEDAFGFQFAGRADGVYSFDPETGELEFLTPDIEQWAELVLADYEIQTGFPVLHQWQVENGAIKEGYRLAPAIPFFLGGKFEANEMRAKESIELMRFRADIYRQVKDLPDGAHVRLGVNWESNS